MKSPDMIQKLRALGAEPAYGDATVLGQAMRRDLDFWQDVAKALPHLVKK